MNSEIRLIELRKFLAQIPNDPFIQYAISLEIEKMGKIDEALDSFEDLLKKHPDYLPVYYTLSSFYFKSGRLHDASDLLEKGMVLAEAQGKKNTLREIKELREEVNLEIDDPEQEQTQA